MRTDANPRRDRAEPSECASAEPHIAGGAPPSSEVDRRAFRPPEPRRPRPRGAHVPCQVGRSILMASSQALRAVPNGAAGRQVAEIAMRLLDDAYISWCRAQIECHKALRAWLDSGG